MGKNSAIEWCDHTFNPWIGCTHVSEGCRFCYAETLMDQRMGRAQWGPNGTRVRTSAEYWKQPLRWNKEARAKGAPALVFCASLPAAPSPALVCRTRYTRTGRPWCECKTDNGRWAPWPMPFCRR